MQSLLCDYPIYIYLARKLSDNPIETIEPEAFSFRVNVEKMNM